jgi:uncharacterized protein YecT (DUF1311 family)
LHRKHWLGARAVRLVVTIACAVALTALGLGHARAGTRVALVIGNAAYRHAPALTNPKNDAEDVGRSLTELGFETVIATDLDRTGMNDALDRFSRIVPGADVALFYYSGHGMQFAGKNYLLPVDARLAGADDVNRFRLTPLDDVFDILQAAQGRVVILDACRNNPVEEDLKRRLASVPGASRDASMSRGLSRVPAGNGLIVAYSTQANDVAADGLDRNSPFTAAFLQHVGTPDVDLRQMLLSVQNDVARRTQGRQRPELSLSAIGEIKLKDSGQPGQVPSHPEPRPPAPQPPFDPRAMELSYWESVRNSSSPAIIQTYLDRYPNGVFAALARARLEELRRPPPVQPPPVRPPVQRDTTVSLPGGLTPRTYQQPSIDCRAPNEPIEHLICADGDLAEWDGRMGRLFRARLNDGRDRERFTAQQRAWIARRDAECGVPKSGSYSIAQLAPLKPCIVRMTRERANQLASE